MKRISTFFVAFVVTALAVVLVMSYQSQSKVPVSAEFATEGEFTLANLSDSIEVLHSKANGDHAEANFWLGLAYAVGWGVPRDYLLSDHYFNRSIEQGYSRANAHLGMMHFAGYGRSVDYKKWKHYERLVTAEGRRTVADPTVQFLVICQPEQSKFRSFCDRLTASVLAVDEDAPDFESIVESVSDPS